MKNILLAQGFENPTQPIFRTDVVQAQGPQNLTELIYVFLDLIELIIPLLMSLAFLVFVWGLVKFIAKIGGDAKAVQDGKNLMKWGLIALFVMSSVWGILAFFSNEFGFNFALPLLPE